MSNSISKDELMKKLNSSESSKDSKETKEDKKEVAESKKARRYQLPSAPCTLHFPWEQDKRNVLDGVFVTEDEKEIEELEKMVKAGCVFNYDKPSDLRQHQIPTPTRKLIDNPGN